MYLFFPFYSKIMAFQARMNPEVKCLFTKGKESNKNIRKKPIH